MSAEDYNGQHQWRMETLNKEWASQFGEEVAPRGNLEQ